MAMFPNAALTGVTPADLAWLTGTWPGRIGDEPAEEHWSALGGNTLMGMFRWLKGGRVSFYELLVIEQEGEHVRLRIRHFDPGLIGWEDKNRPFELVLVHLNGREAAFRELDKPDPRWAVYRREGRNRLVSYFAGSDGTVMEPGLFEYRRR